MISTDPITAESVDNKLQELHVCFEKITGQSLRYSLQQRLWWEFNNEGFTMQDLICVIQFFQRSNRNNTFKYSLKIHSILGDLSRFDSFLGEARAQERNRKPAKTPKESVLAAWWPTIGESVHDHAKTSKDILAFALTPRN